MGPFTLGEGEYAQKLLEDWVVADISNRKWTVMEEPDGIRVRLETRVGDRVQNSMADIRPTKSISQQIAKLLADHAASLV